MNTNRLNCRIIVDEQFTPAEFWCIRMADELRSRFPEKASAGYMPIIEPMRIPGVSRQRMLQCVKREQLESPHVSSDRDKVLCVNVLDAKRSLIYTCSSTGV